MTGLATSMGVAILPRGIMVSHLPAMLSRVMGVACLEKGMGVPSGEIALVSGE